tara:strand:+ start:422 stop:592 length:171 start_codon:yes stop_codon:yes gene_type:complete
MLMKQAKFEANIDDKRHYLSTTPLIAASNDLEQQLVLCEPDMVAVARITYTNPSEE